MIFVLLFFATQAYALSDPSNFSSILIDLEEVIETSRKEQQYTSDSPEFPSNMLNALRDEAKIIPADFIIPEYFKDSVAFWFSIYTQFDSKQVLIHDKNDLGKIYRLLDFSELHNSDLNIFTKYKIQNQLVDEAIHQTKLAFQDLAKNKDTDKAKNLKNTLERLKIKFPPSSKRKAFFLDLGSNLRTQTGQKSMIYQGILNSRPYIPYLKEILDKFYLPEDLLAIPFLESSFNLNAESKVGASGIWQFMPYIADLFMPKISNGIDYRSNPVISSIAAFHLLKQNKMILKRWDLAVPAYNSGTKHLIKARKKFNHVKNLSLEYILTHYNHPHLGFASQNFYSEFLALVYALRYKGTFFKTNGKIISAQFDIENLHTYVNRCPTNLKYLKSTYGNSLGVLNPQFKSEKDRIHYGSLIVSDKSLPNTQFYQLPMKTITKKYPKDWHKGVFEKNCKLIK